MRRLYRSTRYARRERDISYMRFVKTLDCFALLTVDGHRCAPSAVIEADHAGRRGIGQKCNDTETIPLCSDAHRARHAFNGPFKGWTRSRMRAWLDEAIVRTQLLAVACGVWAGPARGAAA
jgi:hypothetical protein